MPGVHAVVTQADMPEIGSKIADLGEGMFNLRDVGRNVLADDKVLYKGHAVAAIAAETVHQALAAADVIDVEYEILPHILDIREAMRPGVPILHEDLRTEAFASATDADQQPTNIAKHFLHEKGDLEQGFADARVVVEREFTTATVHQGYIEPHTATALWNADGHITVLDEHAGHLHRPRAVVQSAAGADFQHQSGADGDRWGIWWQDRRLSPAGGGVVIEEIRPAGQVGDGPRRRAGSDRSDPGVLDAGQDWDRRRRSHHRR